MQFDSTRVLNRRSQTPGAAEEHRAMIRLLRELRSDGGGRYPDREAGDHPGQGPYEDPAYHLPPGGNYSPTRRYYHKYEADNEICPAAWKCTEADIRDTARYHQVPGQNGRFPVTHGDEAEAVDTRPGFWSGVARTLDLHRGPVGVEMSPNGLRGRNRTLNRKSGWIYPEHPLHDGQAERSYYRTETGAWRARTVGEGNNVGPWMARQNRLEGPGIFDHHDRNMRAALGRLKGYDEP